MPNIKNNLIEILILLGVFILLFYSSNPIEYPDSQRYLSKSLNDPPLYSSAITIMQIIFGSLNSIVVLQTLSIGFGIIYFVRTVSSQFDLDIVTKFFISLFLFLPVLQFYRYLLTEPISYAFSLFFVSFVIKLIYNFNYKNLIWISIFTTVMLLTRNQFLFIYPVILILYLGIFILQNSRKTFSLLMISFLFIVFSHNSLIKLNKYIAKGSLTSEEQLGKSVFFFTFMDAIYISEVDDVKLFKNKNIKKTLAIILYEMDQREALIKYYNGRGHFGQSLQDIRYFSHDLINHMAKRENINKSILYKEISITLIKANYKKYIRHIFKKLYDSSWLFVFVPFFMLIPSLISFLKYKSHLSLLVVFLSVFGLANHSTIYLFGRVQPRYLIYTDFIILIFVLIIFTILFRNKNKKNHSKTN